MKRLISVILTGVLVFSLPVLSVLQTNAAGEDGNIRRNFWRKSNV